MIIHVVVYVIISLVAFMFILRCRSHVLFIYDEGEMASCVARAQTRECLHRVRMYVHTFAHGYITFTIHTYCIHRCACVCVCVYVDVCVDVYVYVSTLYVHMYTCMYDTGGIPARVSFHQSIR